MVESARPSSKYDLNYFSSKLYTGGRKIAFVLINESESPLTLVEQYNYHGKIVDPPQGTKIPPGGAMEWSACK